MFRLCVDMANEPLLPEGEVAGLNSHARRNLGPRVDWLFENDRLAAELFALSDCIREDGNDAVHKGALGKEDAEDLLDFTVALLERMFTEPERLSWLNYAGRKEESRQVRAMFTL
jgi:hypothetical protein